MAKFALLLIIVLAVVFVVRTQMRKEAARRAAADVAKTKMVACAHCGLHLPQAEAIVADVGGTALPYCSEAHREAGPTGHGPGKDSSAGPRSGGQ
jgi:uncharacterized protein